MNIWSRAMEMSRDTPPERDRYVDFLRAISILMVITGHWLIVGVFYANGELIPSDVLVISPNTQWLTWLFQVMPIFFIVGGYSNAVSLQSARRRGTDYAGWLSTRLDRLLSPLLPLVMVWGGISLVLHVSGIARPATVQQLTQAALIPTWFLAIYTMVVVLAPVTWRAWQQHGFGSILAFAGMAVLTDAVTFLTEAKWVAWSNYFWVWLAVHQLGYAWREGRIGGTAQQLGIAALGWLTLALLVFAGPWPLAMAGSPDAEVSNTLPPKITLLALGVGQFGLLLAISSPMRKLLDNVRLWAATVLVNSMIMTVYLWHISAMILVGALAFYAGGIGLTVEPLSQLWWLTRPAWILVLFIALVPMALLFAPIEQRQRSSGVRVAASYRQITGAVIACLGIALISRFGFGNAPLPMLDVFAFACIFVGAAISGVLRSTTRQMAGSVTAKGGI